MHDATWHNHPGAIEVLAGTAAMDLALYARHRATAAATDFSPGIRGKADLERGVSAPPKLVRSPLMKVLLNVHLRPLGSPDE